MLAIRDENERFMLIVSSDFTGTGVCFGDHVLVCNYKHPSSVHSPRPSDAFMCQLRRPSLVQIMVCRLFGDNPFSDPLITYSGLPAVREKSGKIFIFQGQGKVREFCEKSGKIFEWRKVREESGNFAMNARNIFFMEVDTLLFLI